MTLLSVRDLVVEYRTGAGPVRAVDGATLEIPAGAIVGLVGESGCGKSTLGRALMGVLPAAARVAAGEIWFEGAELTTMGATARRALRWRRMAFVPQTAMNALDPVQRLRAQLLEVLRDRGGLRSAAAEARASPLVIADEPVTALDVIVQRQVLDVLRDLQARLGLALLLVTHDIAVVAYACNRIAVMYAGRIVESGPADAVLERPLHPYTMGLTHAFPDVHGDISALVPIEGAPPSLLTPPPGCRFAPRCPFAEARCIVESPPLTPHGADHDVACWRADDAAMLRARAAEPATWMTPSL